MYRAPLKREVSALSQTFFADLRGNFPFKGKLELTLRDLWNYGRSTRCPDIVTRTVASFDPTARRVAIKFISVPSE